MLLININSIPGKIKKIDGFDDYYVTEFGEIYSQRLRGNEKKHRLRKLKPKDPGSASKYLNVVLCRDGEQKTVPIHRIVAMAFVSGYFEGAVVNHIDGNNRNNKSDNLEWVTQKDNIHKSYATSGLSAKRNYMIWSLYDPSGNKLGSFSGNKDMCDFIVKHSLPISCSMIVKHHNHNGYYVKTQNKQ